MAEFFYDQSIRDQTKKYDEIRKIATEQEDDYTTGYLLDYQYFKVIINQSQSTLASKNN